MPPHPPLPTPGNPLAQKTQRASTIVRPTARTTTRCHLPRCSDHRSRVQSTRAPPIPRLLALVRTLNPRPATPSPSKPHCSLHHSHAIAHRNHPPAYLRTTSSIRLPPVTTKCTPALDSLHLQRLCPDSTAPENSIPSFNSKLQPQLGVLTPYN